MYKLYIFQEHVANFQRLEIEYCFRSRGFGTLPSGAKWQDVVDVVESSINLYNGKFFNENNAIYAKLRDSHAKVPSARFFEFTIEDEAGNKNTYTRAFLHTIQWNKEVTDVDHIYLCYTGYKYWDGEEFKDVQKKKSIIDRFEDKYII